MRNVGLLLLVVATVCTALPVRVPPEKQGKKKDPPSATNRVLSQEKRDEYQRYIDELMTELGGDSEIRKELEKMTPEDLERLMEMPGNHGDERTPEEEDWREEMDEQRRLQRHRFDKDNGIDERPDGFRMDDMPNQQAEMERRMREQNQRIVENDQRRHQQFVQHEMQQEHERRLKLKGLSEKDRLEADEKHQAEIAKARNHPKVPVPGTKHQMEDTWEDEGFDPNNFNVETFFHMQDTNGDGVLDAGEIEAMLVTEAEKLHSDPASPLYHEELRRMRQHVVTEVDTNKDGLVEMDEFLASTKAKSFADDHDWQGVEDEDDYTDEEFDEYEKMLAEQENHEAQMMQDGEHHAPIEDRNVNQDHLPPLTGHQDQPPQHHQQQQQHHEQQQQHHEQQQQQQHHEQQQQQQHHEQQQQQQHHEQQQQQQHHEQQQQQHHEQQQQQQHHEQQQQQQHHEQQQQQHHEQQQQQQHHEQQQQQHEQPQQQHHEQQQQHEQQQPEQHQQPAAPQEAHATT